MPEPKEAAELPDPQLSREERELGMGRDITRRDFVNAVAIGAGTALLGCPAPGGRSGGGGKTAGAGDPWHPFTGYGGVGDYAQSNGNTWEVMNAAHSMRDGNFSKLLAAATKTGEVYDLVVVGGGFAGVTAAYFFQKETGGRRTCLVLDNHPVVGGEAKRNEFIVNGQRLVGPQGSNDTDIPSPSVGWRGELWRDLGLPTEFQYGSMAAGRKSMQFAPDNYLGQLWADEYESHGFFFDTPKPQWVRNPWGHDLAGTPWPEEVRRDLLRWRREPAEPFKGTEDELKRWLDTMTYEQYLTNVRKLHPEVARYADPIVAAAIGLGADVLSAYAAFFDEFPGFQGLGSSGFIGLRSNKLSELKGWASFPGGNDAILRSLVKALVPEGIEGTAAFADVNNGRIRFDALDRPGSPCRIRGAATAVGVDGNHEKSAPGRLTTVTYVKDGKLYSVQARAVVVASGSWAAKHIVQNMPEDYQAAMAGFPRAPVLVANVALNNWRFLYDLGYSACSWRGGFGFYCNIRPNMYVGDYRPPLDPDQPNILTFYVPFNENGIPLDQQGPKGRQRMLSTSYRDYERTILGHMVKLFGSSGFDPKRDVAGVILNRWGHAYPCPGPGFYYGRDGKPAPSQVLRQPLGRIAFAHSELAGNQNWPAAATEGRRAAQQAVAML